MHRLISSRALGRTGFLGTITALSACGAPPHLADGSAAAAGALTAGARLAVVGVQDSRGVPAVAAFVTDGNLATRWAAPGDGAWIQLDLGASRDVTGVRVAWCRGVELGQRFTIHAGASVASLESVAAAASTADTKSFQDVSLPATAARYVRLVGHGPGADPWTCIAELHAFGGDAPSPGATDAGSRDAAPGDAGTRSADAGTPDTATGDPPVFSEGFEDLPAGARWLGMGDTAVTDGCGVNGGKCLRVSYRPSGNGSPRIQAERAVPPAREYTLNYDLFLEPGFEFVKGGKLPGLSPVDHVTGCDTSVPEGWSLRAMWRREGAVQTYFYQQLRSESCGEGPTSATFRLQAGRWHAFSVHLRVNSTADASDGLAEVFVDGVPVSSQGGLRLRGADTQASLVNNFFFSSFYGGSDSSWSPSTTTHARFDNFAVHPGLRVRGAPGL